MFDDVLGHDARQGDRNAADERDDAEDVHTMEHKTVTDHAMMRGRGTVVREMAGHGEQGKMGKVR
jgi:hypothetical protein